MCAEAGLADLDFVRVKYAKLGMLRRFIAGNVKNLLSNQMVYTNAVE